MSVAAILEPRAFAKSALNGREVNGLLPEDSLYEIVDGQRVELPPMGILSTFLASRLCNLLAQFVDAHRLGVALTEPLLVLDGERDLRRRPDVAFVAHATWPLDRPLPPEGDWEVVPDLAVEVVSPSDLAEQVFAKIVEYFHYGVKQVWLILPKLAMIYIYDAPTAVRILTAEQELANTVVPGFRLQLRELFQRASLPGIGE